MTGNFARLSMLVATLFSLLLPFPNVALAQSTAPQSSTVSFTDTADYATGGHTYWVAAGDFRGIGKMDLAVANAGTWNPDCAPNPGTDNGSVSILLGNGDGTFQKTVDLLAGASPTSVAVGHFTASGHVDLVVANACSNPGTVSVFLGNGDGTFQPARTFPVGAPGPLSVAVGTFTGSGHQDLVTANFGPGGYASTGNTISVLLGNGDGTFQAPQTHTLLSYAPYGVAVGTFTSSGHQDVVVTTFRDPCVGGTCPGSYIYVLLGNGDGTFQVARPVPVGNSSGPTIVAVGNFTHSGHQDLAVSLYGQGYTQTIAILLGNGDGTFQPAQGYGPVPPGPIGIAIGDFNGSGIQDLAVASWPNSGNTVSVLMGNGDGTFQAPQEFTVGSTGVDAVAAGTFDGTGQLDLAVSGWNSGTVSILKNTTQGPPPAATPVLSPTGGTFSSSVQVTITDSTSGAAIYYTTDGSTPTSSSTQYAAPITVTTTETIKAIATAPGFSTSAVASGTYTIAQQVATPTFTPGGGTYVGSVTVTLSDTTSGATIYYTTDGSAPTTASSVYGLPLLVTQTTTINAMATSSGMVNSGVASATYTIVQQVATPTFTPVGGTYNAPQSVTISDATPGATVYYTTDGSPPTTASPVYSGALSVPQTTTIKAMAAASGMANSGVASATYTIAQQVAATPTFSPGGGTYIGSQYVTISDATPGATIYYTTDGSTPTTASSVYGTGLSVTQTTTINAMAVASGMTNSGVASAAYTIIQRVATPTISPSGGTYIGSVTVTLSDATAGGTIYYTTDGSTPTTASPVYSGALSVTQTMTISAMAAASGMANSGVASATYTIVQQVATPTFSPGSGTYVGSATVTLSDATPGATIHYTTDGSPPTATSPAYGGALSLTQNTTVRAMATASGMADSGTGSATYTIQVMTPTFSLAAGTYNAPQSVSISDATPGGTIYYTTDGSTPTTASPVYGGAISVTQTMTIRAMAAASGMVNSSVASATYTLRAATPTFSPPGGSYLLPQFVSISDASPGVTIYYTTDGSTPTTGSTVYSGPILVLTSTTIKAIAVAPGWSQSPVATATYSQLL